MPRFVVRIQLNHAKSEDYTNVHSAMRKINFFKFIQGTDYWYKLPSATYYGRASLTSAQLLDYLDKLIQNLLHEETTKEQHEILITEESSISWRLFVADSTDPDLPPAGKYLVSVI